VGAGREGTQVYIEKKKDIRSWLLISNTLEGTPGGGSSKKFLNWGTRTTNLCLRRSTNSVGGPCINQHQRKHGIQAFNFKGGGREKKTGLPRGCLSLFRSLMPAKKKMCGGGGGGTMGRGKDERDHTALHSYPHKVKLQYRGFAKIFFSTEGRDWRKFSWVHQLSHGLQ